MQNVELRMANAERRPRGGLDAAMAALIAAHAKAQELDQEREKFFTDSFYCDDDDGWNNALAEIDEQIAELPRQIRILETYIRDLGGEIQC